MKSAAILILFILITSFSFNSVNRPVLDIVAKGVLADGTEEEIVQMQIHEYLKTSFFVLLNYVFFDEGSAEIPSRYTRFKDFEQTNKFDPTKQFLKWEVLDVYWNILNVIGYRLRNNPDETITLTGCNSNKGVEEGNLELSARRAENIKDYLTGIWKIDPSRIILAKPRNLPQKPSISDTNPEDSEKENRRVEIHSNWKIIEPLVIQDTTRITNPPVLFFYTYVKSRDSINESKISIKQKGKDLRDPYRFLGPPREVLRWRIKENEIPVKDIPILYRLFAKSKISGESPAKKINVVELSLQTKEKLRIDTKEYSRYSLMLFDFDDATLNKNHDLILKMIRKHEEVDDSTKFYITGYTDKTGQEDRNLQLSFLRSNNTKEALLKLGINKEQVIECNGLGESSSPYYRSAIEKLMVRQGKYVDPSYLEYEDEYHNVDYNRYPEGRFYCRTVVIEIENTVKQD